jgi:hypothetical protein
MKWKEAGILDGKLKLVSDYYSYKEARGLIQLDVFGTLGT